MKPAFTCLYYLENITHCILEIKRKDLPANADISDVFRWIFLDKQNKQIISLTFRSMDSSGEVQERFFDQGYLKFNNQTATYIEKFNSAQYHLENKTGSVVPEEILETVSAYIHQ